MKSTVLIAAAFLAPMSRANLITNGSFEDGNFVPNGQNVMSLGVTSTTMTGWTVYQDAVSWVGDPNPFNGAHASDGSKSLDLTDYQDGPPYGGVRQSLLTTPGVRYRVSFDLGTHPTWTAYASINVSAAGNGQTFSSASGSQQKWDTYSWEFTANSASTELTLVGVDQTYAYIGLDNVVVTPVGPTLSGQVTLADFNGAVAGRIVTIDIFNGGNSVSVNATLDAEGNFMAPAPVPDGVYTVAIKGSHWLRKAVGGISITLAGANSVSATLTNGDIDDDNEVAIGDYAILSVAFNSSSGDPNWNAEADLNGDESVDIGDYAILSTNYGNSGD